MCGCVCAGSPLPSGAAWEWVCRAVGALAREQRCRCVTGVALPLHPGRRARRPDDPRVVCVLLQSQLAKTRDA